MKRIDKLASALATNSSETANAEATKIASIGPTADSFHGQATPAPAADNNADRNGDSLRPADPEVWDNDAIKLSQTQVVDADSFHLKLNNIFVEPIDNESESAINSYNELRTHVIHHLDDNKLQSLMVTGPRKGVGKTVTAINLAIGIARHSRRTALLVDLDLRSPSIHNYFNFNPDYGIVDAAQGGCSLERCLVNPGIERLTLLPGNNSYANSTELLSSDQLLQIIAEVKSRYSERIVVFDVPPVLGCDDVMALKPIMDSCLVVIEEGETSRAEAGEVMSRLDGLPVVAMVMNKSERPEPGYYPY